MWSKFGSYLFIFLCVANGEVSSSVVQFEQQPGQILPAITKTLTLTCTLSDSPSINFETLSTPSPTGLVGKRAVVSTQSHIKFLTSLAVFRNGQLVASITPFSPAAALLDVDTLNVTGDVSGASGDRGYINLTWKYPQEQQSGNYSCEANGISDTGHNVVHSASEVVRMSDVNLADIMGFLHQQDLKDISLEKENSDLKTQLGQLQNDSTNLKTQVSQFQKENTNLKTQVTQLDLTANSLKSEVASLTKQLNQKYHVRLVGGDYRRTGTVEVSYHGFVNPLCDDWFQIEEANVICRMLGWNGASSITTENHFDYPPHNGDFILENLKCNGTEANLDECNGVHSNSSSWVNIYHDDCVDGEEAGVICNTDKLP